MPSYQQSISKAIKAKLEPPKRKHVRNIIIGSHAERGASTFFREVFKKPLENNELSCYKALVTIHSVLQQGHPRAIEDSYLRVAFFQSIQNAWKRKSRANKPADFPELIIIYSDYLIRKISFHHFHVFIPNDFSLETYKKSNYNLTKIDLFELLTAITDLQQEALTFQKEVFAQLQKNDCKYSSLIPLTLDIFNMYQFQIFLINILSKKSTEMDFEMLNGIVDKFNQLYPNIRDFFVDSNGIESVRSVIASPILSKDPPQFELTRKLTKSESLPKMPSQETGKEIEIPMSPKPIKSEPPKTHYNPFTHMEQPKNNPFMDSIQPTPPLQMQPSFNPFVVTPVQPVVVVTPVFRSHSMLTASAPSSFPEVKHQHENFQFKRNTVNMSGLETLSEMTKSLKLAAEQESRRKQMKSDGESVRLDEIKRKEVEEKARKAVQEEADREVNALKAKLQELETKIQLEKEENKKVQEKLQFVKDEENALREHINLKKISEETNNEEETQWIGRQLNLTKELIDRDLLRFDIPTNLGSDFATVQSIELTINLILETSIEFISICAGPKQIFFSTLSKLSTLFSQLMEDSKGFSRRLEDIQARERLLEASRNVGKSLLNLLSIAESQKELHLQTEAAVELKSTLITLKNVIRESENNLRSEDDLESVAERELLLAAKSIESAAQSLIQSNLKRESEKIPGVPDVAGAISEATLAITKATSMLVVAAAKAQKERIENGLSSSENLYRKDTIWCQGLISSAREVSSNVQTLISTANDTVNGNLAEENVIAASKSVAASTAQLIAACRAKSTNPNSEAQLKINQASKAVAIATNQLLSAAKESTKEKNEEEETPNSRIGWKVKEIELQAQVLRLEKEMESTRNRLFDMRRQNYQ